MRPGVLPLRLYFGIFSTRARTREELLCMKCFVQGQSNLASPQTCDGGPGLHRPPKMYHPRVALEIGSTCGYANRLMECRCGGPACWSGAGGIQQKVDISQQPHRSLFGAVLQTNSFALSVGKNEFHRLIGLRDSRRAVKSHSSGLDVDF